MTVLERSADVVPQTISTFAGTGASGFSGDQGPATSAKLYRPSYMVRGEKGCLYLCDSENHRVRKIATDGTIFTVAGTGTAGSTGDGGHATSARLNSPSGLESDDAGNLYIAEYRGHRVRKVSTDGRISTVAGTGQAGHSGDEGSATSARLNSPVGLALGAGELYIACRGGHKVRKVSTDHRISTVAGTGRGGYSSDGGPATSARLSDPHGVALDDAGNLYIAELRNHRVRKVSTDHRISTVAGTGQDGHSGDGGPATSAQLSGPTGLALDRAGNLYIVECWSHRIRKVAGDGTISTVAGTGTGGYSGDGGPATSAQLRNPLAAALSEEQTLFVTCSGNHGVRAIALAPPGRSPQRRRSTAPPGPHSQAPSSANL
ncbi:NHL repeat-containing protein [Embleya sp. NPDC020630]|uniref:NHL repeat-containing protein n=1 Tax=Embleya sp. NPDC020630 TaxID=3363979 RepID=UPI0037A54FF0